MDKLKQNTFWIAVGGVAVVLVVLAYFLVFAPLGKLAELEAKIESNTKKIQSSGNRKEKVPTQAYVKFLEEKRDNDKRALEKGKEFYDQLAQQFNLYFGDDANKPELAVFGAKYNDAVQGLVKAYREKHNIKPDEQNADMTPPKVNVMGEALDEAKIPLAMKEFWIIQAVFQAVDKLNLRGLKAIDFPGRTAAEREREAGTYNKWINVKVQIELPFAKIESFLRELYASPRVPVQLDDLVWHKTPESTGQFTVFKREKKLKDASEANKVSYESEFQDPPVLFDFSLSAFDWTGVPPEPEPDTMAADDEAEGKAKKKTPKKTSKKQP